MGSVDAEVRRRSSPLPCARPAPRTRRCGRRPGPALAAKASGARKYLPTLVIS